MYGVFVIYGTINCILAASMTQLLPLLFTVYVLYSGDLGFDVDDGIFLIVDALISSSPPAVVSETRVILNCWNSSTFKTDRHITLTQLLKRAIYNLQKTPCHSMVVLFGFVLFICICSRRALFVVPSFSKYGHVFVYVYLLRFYFYHVMVSSPFSQSPPTLLVILDSLSYPLTPYNHNYALNYNTYNTNTSIKEKDEFSVHGAFDG